MKCIFDGGWNKTDQNSIKNNILNRYSGFLLEELNNGKKLLIVTNAKPANHYDVRIEHLTTKGAIAIGRNTTDTVDWDSYDYILVLGGNNIFLSDELIRLNFSFDILKENVVYMGCSAGTVLMAHYWYDYDREKKEVSFFKGFLTSNQEMYLVHADNTWYVDEYLEKEVEKFAKENNLKVVPIKENEVVERDFE